MGPRAGERGFTLLEVVVAVALWIVLGGTLLYVTQGVLAATEHAAAERKAYVALTHVVETLDAESSSALAIFIPAQDVLGDGNADGHELDFYSRDAERQGHFWAYRWDATSQTLARYTYAVPGATASASDPPLAGITAFGAVRKLASALTSPDLAGYAPRDVAVNFGYPGVDGGNAITDVTIANARNKFELELLPGTMASGFEVVVSTFVPSAAPTASGSTAAPAPTFSTASTPTPSAAPSAMPSASGATPTATLTPPAPSPSATLATSAPSATPAATPTPCYAAFSFTLTFFGLTWWEGQQAGSPCGGYITAVAFAFANFPAVDMVALDSAFAAIPHPGLYAGYFVELQDMNLGAVQVVPSSYIYRGDTLSATAAVPCKYVFSSNPATIAVTVAFGGYPIATNDSAIGSLVTNLASAIPDCTPVE